ncbi:HupE/UreJ family protein [Zhongshania aquimaris]|uniref:HupE/UreJ family protein n=1 Tax=Zhongshania aquimaris TaxID=2857107 RepID=A0ABS6VUD0_9GAMM|nr:HupE/UreJ family protein [Zhongshania aquimaris]MBW2941335.1 HupE/UreJ family protein [Zhongshania aquimaris]
MRHIKILFTSATLIFCSFYSVGASAHKLAPSLLKIIETDTGIYQIVWRTPKNAEVSPRPVFPESCESTKATVVSVNTAFEHRWHEVCQDGLAGKLIRIDSLGASRTVAMLNFKPLSGVPQQRILTVDAPNYIVPEGQGGGSVFTQYVQLGIEHILVGTDHLFFVTALLLLATSWRSLLKTVTAFTLGHSVTLALVSLGLIPHWPALVEFSIAVTILILALELSRPTEGEGQHYIRRHQWLVASAFGLVHGLGFAGVLQEIGLPYGDVISALLAFNVGIELGQLVFVGFVAGLFFILRRSSIPAYQFLRSASILAMGGFSVYWCLDRGTEMLGQIL